MIELMVGWYGFWIEHVDGLAKYGPVPAGWASSRGTQQGRSHLLPYVVQTSFEGTGIPQQCAALYLDTVGYSFLLLFVRTPFLVFVDVIDSLYYVGIP